MLATSALCRKNRLGPTQYHAQELVKEFGLKLHPQFDDGKHVLELGGKFISCKLQLCSTSC